MTNSQRKAVERPSVIEIEFRSQDVHLDDIVPYADADVQTAFEVLEIRRRVGELWFARQEDLEMGEMHEAEAKIILERAEKKAGELSAAALKLAEAQSRRAKILADRARFRARHRELEIMTHLRREIEE